MSICYELGMPPGEVLNMSLPEQAFVFEGHAVRQQRRQSQRKNQQGTR